MTTSLEQLFLQRQKEKKDELKQKEEARPLELASRVRKVYSDPSLISKIEEKLIEHGSVTVKRTPCTCESGGCITTKGFKNHLQDMINEWEEKGVLIDFSIDQTFYMKSVKHSRASVKSTIYVN